MSEPRKFHALTILAALAVSFKVLGPLYPLAPIFSSLIAERRAKDVLRKALLGSALFIAIAGILFAISSFSPKGYFTNLSLAAGAESQAPEFGGVIASLMFGGVIVAPLVLAQRRFVQGGIPIVTLGASMLTAAILSGKPGAGPYYMTPFAPLTIYLAERAVAFRQHDVAWRNRLGGLSMIVAVAFAPIWLFAFFGETRSLASIESESEKREEIRKLFQNFRMPKWVMALPAWSRISFSECRRHILVEPPILIMSIPAPRRTSAF
jgi:hypothetical protein